MTEKQCAKKTNSFVFLNIHVTVDRKNICKNIRGIEAQLKFKLNSNFLLFFILFFKSFSQPNIVPSKSQLFSLICCFELVYLFWLYFYSQFKVLLMLFLNKIFQKSIFFRLIITEVFIRKTISVIGIKNHFVCFSYYQF